MTRVLGLVIILMTASLAIAEGELANRAAEGLIQVKSVTEVDGRKTEIVLGDLIVARGVSEAALSVIKRARLADTPKPGETRTFTAMGIEQVFKPYLRDIELTLGEYVNLRVPARVTVTRKALRITGEEVVKQMRSQLKEFCADCIFNISNLTMPVLPPTLSDGAVWSIRLRSEIPKGSFSLPLEVAHEDGTKRTYWISGVLSVSRQVPVASGALSAGARVQPEDYVMQIKDVTYANDIPVTEKDLGAMVTGRSIAAGQILWRGGFRRELAVRVGDAVKVIAGSEGWQVSIDGVSQSSAYVGDIIKVKIGRTQKLVSGVLAERGVVEVH